MLATTATSTRDKLTGKVFLGVLLASLSRKKSAGRTWGRDWDESPGVNAAYLGGLADFLANRFPLVVLVLLDSAEECLALYSVC